MVIDTSAIVAILSGEPERDEFLSWLAGTPVRCMSAMSLLEAGIVIESRYGQAALGDLELLIFTAKIETIAFDKRQADMAQIAWRRFGKGNHPAKLNFGDCCVYALAKKSGMPVLCKGRDFALTDVDVLTPESL